MNMARAELSENKDEQEIQVHNMQASLATIMSKLNAAQQDLKTRYFTMSLGYSNGFNCLQLGYQPIKIQSCQANE